MGNTRWYGELVTYLGGDPQLVSWNADVLDGFSDLLLVLRGFYQPPYGRLNSEARTRYAHAPSMCVYPAFKAVFTASPTSPEPAFQTPIISSHVNTPSPVQSYIHSTKRNGGYLVARREDIVARERRQVPQWAAVAPFGRTAQGSRVGPDALHGEEHERKAREDVEEQPLDPLVAQLLVEPFLGLVGVAVCGGEQVV